MSDSHWRRDARAVIDRVVAENPGKTPEELIELVDAAYPFGERKMWPYKMWLLERRAFRQRLYPAADGPLGRVCRACGADIGHPCREYMKAWPMGTTRPTLDTFHDARVEMPAPTSGPLFANVEEQAIAELHSEPGRHRFKCLASNGVHLCTKGGDHQDVHRDDTSGVEWS